MIRHLALLLELNYVIADTMNTSHVEHGVIFSAQYQKNVILYSSGRYMYNINAMLPRIATYLGNEWSVSTPRPLPLAAVSEYIATGFERR